MASKSFAIVAGVGPGTGASVARRFAQAYPVVLLARGSDKFEELVKEINSNGGQAIGISTDVTSAESLDATFKEIEEKFPGAGCAVANFNAAAGMHRKPFLELTDKEFASGFEVSAKGAFLFSQRILPYLLKNADAGPHPPTLIFTSATAAVKANPQMASFASSCYAKRALAISLAKEFGPKGVHVAHAIIDGPIDIPGKTDYRAKLSKEAKIDPDDIAQTYWDLHTQTKRCFVFEVDIRTSIEKW